MLIMEQRFPLLSKDKVGGGGFFGAQQFNSNAKGAYGWNQAIKSEADAFKVFAIDDNKAKPLREAGFGQY
jgi:hypothetical protein